MRRGFGERTLSKPSGNTEARVSSKDPLSATPKIPNMAASVLRGRRGLANFGLWSKTLPRLQPKILPAEIPIEEELVSGYDPRYFYPVNPGDVLDSKYEITAKLGFGGSSTIWLGRDTHR